ncbi:MAG: GxxExxY protein [Gemmatimonadota bacterium]|nr:GxxExxY protein [Gemmatimonadota bacterium]
MKQGELPLLHAELTRSVIGGFFQVHRELGFGFREHIYALALERELSQRGHEVAREVHTLVYFRGKPLARQTLDMVVDEKLVLEIKTGERPPPGGTAQLFGYLCATDLELGLLLYFGPEPKFYRVIFENRLKRRTAEAAPAAVTPRP